MLFFLMFNTAHAGEFHSCIQATSINKVDRSTGEEIDDFLNDLFRQRSRSNSQPSAPVLPPTQDTPKKPLPGAKSTGTNSTSAGPSPVSGGTGPLYPQVLPQNISPAQSQVLKPAIQIPIAYARLPQRMVLTQDQKHLIYIKDDQTRLSIMELQGHKEIAEIIHDGYIQSILLSQDGKYVFTVSVNGVLKITETTHWTTVKEISSSIAVKGYLSPDDKFIILVSAFRSPNIGEIVEVGTWKVIRRNFPVTDYINSYGHVDTFTPQGDQMVLQHLGSTYANGNRTYELKVEDIISGRALSGASSVNYGNFTARGIAVSPNNEFVAILTDGYYSVYKWGAWNRLIHQTFTMSLADKVFFSSNSDYLYIAYSTKVDVYRTSDWAHVTTLRNLSHRQIVQLADNERRLYSAGSSGSVMVLDTQNWQQRYLFQHGPPFSGINDMFVTTSGDYVATAGNDMTALISDGHTGLPIGRVQHSGRVSQVLIVGRELISIANSHEIQFTPF